MLLWAYMDMQTVKMHEFGLVWNPLPLIKTHFMSLQVKIV